MKCQTLKIKNNYYKLDYSLLFKIFLLVMRGLTSYAILRVSELDRNIDFWSGLQMNC